MTFVNFLNTVKEDKILCNDLACFIVGEICSGLLKDVLSTSKVCGEFNYGASIEEWHEALRMVKDSPLMKGIHVRINIIPDYVDDTPMVQWSAECSDSEWIIN